MISSSIINILWDKNLRGENTVKKLRFSISPTIRELILSWIWFRKRGIIILA